MKKLDRLLLKSFLGPLLLTFTISVFVLLMQLVWLYVDDMVGKGLDIAVIAELLLYAAATVVPMALPIAVLFASIMTMGNFGEKYELVAIKAGGISLRRMMMPMAFVCLLLTGVAFYFANNVLPVAMYRYRTTLYDIQRKKPAISIRPSEYYSDIDGYVIRIDRKSKDGRTLYDIIVYDHSEGLDRTNVIVADRGMMQTTPDDRYLLFTLYDGYTYSEPMDGENFRTRPLTSIGFKEQVLTFDISSFAFNKTDDDRFRGDYKMMNVSQLDTSVRQLEASREDRYKEFNLVMMNKLRAYRATVPDTAKDFVYKDVFRITADTAQVVRKKILIQALAVARNAESDVGMYEQIIRSDSEYINRHYIEWMRKFTLSVACLLLFFIGAPFGSIVRKGGLGMPLVASVVFFVLYYVVGMISEKSVREGAVGPIGMWISTFAFIPIGLLFTYQATTDVNVFDLARWRKFLGKVFRKK
ncbi:MAG: LptF/LptG family permease [Bacteroidales bacterium]|nr:LptF/LptG family permease [Bacteroidales bacterium]